MLGLESNLCKRQVVASSVAFVLREEEWVVNASGAPKGRAILVVLQQFRKDQAVLDINAIVGIEADEQEVSVLRLNALIWPSAEVLVQDGAGMRLEHGVCDAQR